MSRTLFVALLALASASAAPVPKATEKGDPWKFPDLKSKAWTDIGDGLKVWDVKEGEGDAVEAGATVAVKYTGWLTDGTEFDSSKKHGQKPLQFGLNLLITGWKTGMLGMKPGGIRRLYVPAELAYGKNGIGKVPPDATLVFVIELIDVKK